jgi:hypothetical protein
MTNLKPVRFAKLDRSGKRLYTWLVPPDLPGGYLESGHGPARPAHQHRLRIQGGSPPARRAGSTP